MTAPALLTSQRKIFTKLFPWLARFGLAPSGALAIRSAAGRVELEGGGPGVARVGDLVVRLYLDSASGILYASASPAAPYTWTPVASGILPPTPTDAGTSIRVTTGSAKVTCG
jgi:hypothetical protein